MDDLCVISFAKEIRRKKEREGGKERTGESYITVMFRETSFHQMKAFQETKKKKKKK